MPDYQVINACNCQSQVGRWEDDELGKLPSCILDKTTSVIEQFVFRGIKDAMNAVGK